MSAAPGRTKQALKSLVPSDLFVMKFSERLSDDLRQQADYCARIAVCSSEVA